jgi:hypothetical protein
MAAKKTFVNLPVKNLDKSKDFFAKLGFDRRACQDTDGNISAQTAAIATPTNIHCDPALLSVAPKRTFREPSIPKHPIRHT